MKLRIKILLLLIPLIVLPLLVLGWFVYAELKTSSETKVKNEIHASIEHLSDLIHADIQTAEANIILFEKNTLLRKYVLTKDEEERYSLLHAPLLRVFRGFQEAFPNYYEIRILTPEGYEDIRRTQGLMDNKKDNEADNPFYQLLLQNNKNTVSSKIGRNPDNNKMALFVGKPLIFYDPLIGAVGTLPLLQGYLLLTVNMDKISNYINTINIGKKGYLLLTDRQGKILS